MDWFDEIFKQGLTAIKTHPEPKKMTKLEYIEAYKPKFTSGLCPECKDYTTQICADKRRFDCNFYDVLDMKRGK